MPALTISSVVNTECFVGTADEPRQVLRVSLDRDLSRAGVVEVDGPTVHGHVDLPPGSGPLVVEVPLDIESATAPGQTLSVLVTARATAGDDVPAARRTAEVVVAEPGWTMYLVSHFHYDPVWWNTQAAYTQVWDLQADDGLTRPVWEHNGFDLVRAHLAMAARDLDYTFVLAEVDYLKPFWDTHPEARAALRELIAGGRVEIMGGTYNEPNTNLTNSETTIRNLVYGVGYQRSILGADPQTAWQLDAFGHDPQFPGLAAEAGLTSSAWARGPHHQWGPVLSTFREVGGDVANMQFPAEFEWLSPSGQGVLTHYMPNHYSAGWWMDSSVSLAEAEEKVYELYLALKPAASTKNLLLPVGTDYTPPNKWVTAIHRDWQSRYVWPRFVCGNPRDFFGAVRAELAERGVAPSPQSRDMNPIYTGKDVSFIDTKQAQRAAEVAALDAEKLAAFASLLGLGRWPERALDKVWRQLAYGAHHDAITGSESDQVYIDLLSGWREAHDLAADIRDRSLTVLTGAIDTDGTGVPLVVVNTAGFTRSDLVRVELPWSHEESPDLRLVDGSGQTVPHVVEATGPGAQTIAFRAEGVPSLGWQVWRAIRQPDAAPADRRWRVVSDGAVTDAPPAIDNEHYRVEVSPAQGGGISSLIERSSWRELVAEGQVANELRAYAEYPAHPEFGEGPWHLLPTGAVVSSADRPATSVRVEHCAIGQRIVVTGEVQDIRYEQRITLWRGLNRVDCRTRVEHSGADRLIRVKFPCPVAGARPVSEVAGAVIARGFAFPEVDTAVAPWTLDNPANNFVALSNTAKLELRDPDGRPIGDYAIAVAEIVVPDLERAAPLARDLVRALARVGITATTSTGAGARSGSLTVDSNLPDIRFVLGGPGDNPFAAELLAAAGQASAERLQRDVFVHGAARLFVPGAEPIESAWVPQADLRGPRAIPAVLVDAANETELQAEIARMATELADGSTSVTCIDADPGTLLDDYTVGLLTYGIPGFAVDTSGALHLSLLRSCTGWPSGVWLDPPRRQTPDGSAFQLQHWTHDFDYSLVSGPGDWRQQDLVSRGVERSTPMHVRVADPHDGQLPPMHSLLAVAPEREVQVQAVKLTGNPCAVGESVPADDRRSLTVRLTESTGLARTAQLVSPLGFVAAHRSDLLEAEVRDSAYVDGVVETPLEGAQIATLVLEPGRAPGGGPSDGPPVLGVDRETAQPIFSRYWLHNRGPAPMGFWPVSVSVSPTVARAGEGPVAGQVSVASHLVDDDFTGMLTVVAPEGWICEPVQRPVHLGPGGHTTFPLEVVVPADAPPGLSFVRVRLATGADGVAEDVLTVLVPGSDLDDAVPAARTGVEVSHEVQMHGTTSEEARAQGLEIACLTPRLELRPGESGELAFRLLNQARSDIDGELMAISPWGTWDLVERAVAGFAVEAESSADVAVGVSVPVAAAPGEWWVLVKFIWFGRVHYSPAVPLVVRAP